MLCVFVSGRASSAGAMAGHYSIDSLLGYIRHHL